MKYSDALTTIYWAKQVASAMDHLHSRKTNGFEDPLVHADLKADNVLIKEKPCECGLDNESWKNVLQNFNEAGICQKCFGRRLDLLTLKITDFGLSRSLTSKRESFSGSVSWMPPEVIEKNDYSKQSDVWSFGVFLWEILSCKVPFSNYDFHVVMYAIVKKEKTPHVPENCPFELREVFNNCWKKNSQDRASFRRILALLEKAENNIDNNYKWNLNESQKPSNKITLDEIERNIRDGKIKLPIYKDLIQDFIRPPPLPAARFHGKKMKVKKQNIGLPQDFQHKFSVRPSSRSPPLSRTQKQLFTIKYSEQQTDPASKNYLSTQQAPTFHRSYNDLETIQVKKPEVMHQSKMSPANFDSNIIYTTLPRNYKHTVKNEGSNKTTNDLYREKDEKYHKKCHQCCQNGANSSRFPAGQLKHFKSTPELANLHKHTNFVKDRVQEMEEQKAVKLHRNHDYIFLKSYDPKRNENDEFDEQKESPVRSLGRANAFRRKITNASSPRTICTNTIDSSAPRNTLLSSFSTLNDTSNNKGGIGDSGCVSGSCINNSKNVFESDNNRKPSSNNAAEHEHVIKDDDELENSPAGAIQNNRTTSAAPSSTNFSCSLNSQQSLENGSLKSRYRKNSAGNSQSIFYVHEFDRSDSCTSDYSQEMPDANNLSGRRRSGNKKIGNLFSKVTNMFASTPTNRSPSVMHQSTTENGGNQNEHPIIEHAICHHPDHNYISHHICFNRHRTEIHSLFRGKELHYVEFFRHRVHGNHSPSSTDLIFSTILQHHHHHNHHHPNAPNSKTFVKRVDYPERQRQRHRTEMASTSHLSTNNNAHVSYPAPLFSNPSSPFVSTNLLNTSSNRHLVQQNSSSPNNSRKNTTSNGGGSSTKSSPSTNQPHLSFNTVIELQSPNRSIVNLHDLEQEKAFQKHPLNMPIQLTQSYTDLMRNIVSPNNAPHNFPSILNSGNSNLSAGVIHQRSRSSEQPSANLSTKIQNPLRMRNQLSTSILVEKLANNKPMDGPITNKAYIPLNDSIYQHQRRMVQNPERVVLTNQNVPPLPLKRISGNNSSDSKNGCAIDRPIPPPGQSNASSIIESDSSIISKQKELQWPTSQAPILNKSEINNPKRPNTLNLSNSNQQGNMETPTPLNTTEDSGLEEGSNHPSQGSNNALNLCASEISLADSQNSSTSSHKSDTSNELNSRKPYISANKSKCENLTAINSPYIMLSDSAPIQLDDISSYIGRPNAEYVSLDQKSPNLDYQIETRRENSKFDECENVPVILAKTFVPKIPKNNFKYNSTTSKNAAQRRF